jgi:hypothetical protein
MAIALRTPLPLLLLSVKGKRMLNSSHCGDSGRIGQMVPNVKAASGSIAPRCRWAYRFGRVALGLDQSSFQLDALHNLIQQ